MTFDENKKWKLPKYSIKKKENKNYECIQQCILLALLNKKYGFILKKRRRQSTVTYSFPTIESIIVNEKGVKEEIQINEIIEHQCTDKLNETYQHEYKKKEEDCKRATYKRRLEKNKRISIHNLLIDMCIEEGYFFNSTMSKKSERGEQLERITEVFYQMKYLFNIKDMKEIGIEISQEINNKIQVNGTYEIEINSSLQHFLN